jgi:hypothetical protein
MSEKQNVLVTARSLITHEHFTNQLLLVAYDLEPARERDYYRY